MNKYEACKLAVSLIVSTAVIGAIVSLILNAEQIYLYFTSVNFREFLDALYMVGPIAVATIPTSSIVMMFYTDIYKKISYSNMIETIGVIFVVASFFVYIVGCVVSTSSGPLQLQYGLSLIPYLIAIGVCVMYNSRISKTVCKFVNAPGDDKDD